jgi:arsenate reductase
MTFTIYHNPECGTSRNTLAMIRQSGEEPEVIEYLKTPPSREKLVELIAAMGITPRDLLREKGTPYAQFGLGDPKWTDDELLDFMIAHPILINRPIVVTPKGTRLYRASDPDQQTDRGDAQGHEAVPAIGSCPRHPAQSGYRSFHQGRRRGRDRRIGKARALTRFLFSLEPG